MPSQAPEHCRSASPACRLPRLLPASLLLLLLGACAGSGTNPYPGADDSLAGRVKICRAGDTTVTSSDQCLQDDAACYQLANGDWCTGPRGNNCPAGSTEMGAGASCPAGARCFQISEGKHCAISFR